MPSVDGSASRLAAGLNAFFAFVEERRDAWRMLFREAADPEAVAVLDRMLAQVTAVVAALIAAEPGAQKLPQGKAEREQGIHLIAQMLVGAVQTRGQLVGGQPARSPASTSWRRRWASPGWGSIGSAAASAGPRG